MRSLNEDILRNLLTERDMAKGKRAANICANLPTDVIDSRIEVLEVAIDIHKQIMAEDAIKEKERNEKRS